jgi:hypothetical protein
MFLKSGVIVEPIILGVIERLGLIERELTEVNGIVGIIVSTLPNILLLLSKIGLNNSYYSGNYIHLVLKKSSKISCALLGIISSLIKSS